MNIHNIFQIKQTLGEEKKIIMLKILFGNVVEFMKVKVILTVEKWKLLDYHDLNSKKNQNLIVFYFCFICYFISIIVFVIT